MEQVHIAIVGRGMGKTHWLTEKIKESFKNNEHIVFMTKEGMKELEELQSYKFDDAPDNVRYAMEYLARVKNEKTDM